MKKSMTACIICLLIVLTSSFSGNIIYGSENKVNEIPVFLYHHIENVDNAEGATITEERFEKDMEFLSENDFTTLLPQDIMAIKSGEMEMPERPIMIAFDDGYESNYLKAFPILKKYEFKATIFVITKSMDKKVSGQVPKLTWEQMREMYESGLVEIQSHSYDLHNSFNDGFLSRVEANGIKRNYNETQEAYELRFGNDLKKSKELIEKNVGNNVFAFAYPYGIYDNWCVKPFRENEIEMAFILGNIPANLEQNFLKLNRYSIVMGKELSNLLEDVVFLNIFDMYA